MDIQAKPKVCITHSFIAILTDTYLGPNLNGYFSESVLDGKTRKKLTRKRELCVQIDWNSCEYSFQHQTIDTEEFLFVYNMSVFDDLYIFHDIVILVYVNIRYQYLLN